jgi:2-methylisocitrate lyase-like PEP mutase family enzyme
MNLVQLQEKTERFRALHAAPGAFVIPNPWDAGSARLLEAMGFTALATSSMAAAATLGRRDGHISRSDAVRLAGEIAAATDLPVSADLESGFGNLPEDVAETIRLAGEAGLVGGSIEDATGEERNPIYDLGLAIERVAAAVEAARALPFRFVLTARAENFIRGNPNLDDTITRLQAYERAGADVLFAPGLRDLETVRTVCSSVSRPVNFMNGFPGAFSVAQLAEVGVKRVSVAASLHRLAMTALRDAAKEIVENGTFGFADHAMTTPEMMGFLKTREQ